MKNDAQSMKKILPKEITSQDLIKFLAVLLMITDHIGHHFYPDEIWFRVFGRLCVPIWFFLIGFAKTNERPLFLWAAAVLVLLSAIISGQYVFPLNILFSMIIMRYYRDGFIQNALHNPESMRGIFLILLLSTLPSGLVFEYGSMGMLFVIIGHIVRNKEQSMHNVSEKYILLFICLSFFSFFIAEGITLPSLSVTQAVVLFSGLVAIAVLLWRFEARTYPILTQKLPFPLASFIRFTGRHTLEIYVVHILFFRVACMLLYPDKYDFMGWGWLPASMMRGVM